MEKSFRWHLETQQNEIGSIFKLNIKKYREMKLLLPEGGGAGGIVQFFFNLTHFFDIQFKKTSNLIFLGFKVPSERFFQKDIKTVLTF